MIQLTNAEALDILKALSRIDGFLRPISNSQYVMCELDYPLEILSEKLIGKNNEEKTKATDYPV